MLWERIKKKIIEFFLKWEFSCYYLIDKLGLRLLFAFCSKAFNFVLNLITNKMMNYSDHSQRFLRVKKVNTIELYKKIKNFFYTK